jgi:hypothetical protein
MAKKTKTEKATLNLAALIASIVGALVSLSVGAGMANRVLTLESLYIPSIVTVIAGWVVIVGTILSIVMALFNK